MRTLQAALNHRILADRAWGVHQGQVRYPLHPLPSHLRPLNWLCQAVSHRAGSAAISTAGWVVRADYFDLRPREGRDRCVSRERGQHVTTMTRALHPKTREARSASSTTQSGQRRACIKDSGNLRRYALRLAPDPVPACPSSAFDPIGRLAFLRVAAAGQVSPSSSPAACWRPRSPPPGPPRGGRAAMREGVSLHRQISTRWS